MAETSAVGMREVIPNQTVAEKCRDFTINTGGAQSTLQDLKLPDSSGGFVYGDQTKLQTRNRFIVWRTSHDILDLFEASLDWNLSGSRVRYRFQDTPVLSGISVHETFHHIVILVATVSSVHKLVFPHPCRLHKQDFQVFQDSEEGIPSIFAEASNITPKEHYHVVPGMGVTPLPHTSASWLDSDEEAIFALANPLGITLVKLGNMRGIVTVHALKTSSYLGRLWDNLGGMLSSSSKAMDGTEAVLSLVIHPIQNDAYVFALCKDHKIRMWLTSSNDCVMIADVVSNQQVQGSRAALQLGAQNHMLRKVTGGDNHDSFALAAFLCFAEHSQFCIFRPVRTDGQFGLKHLATVYAPEYDLIDFSVTPQGRITALWTNPDGVPILRYAHFGSAKGEKAGWSDVILESSLEPEFASNEFDPRQVYLKQLFYPGRFSIQTLSKTVNIYRRSVDMSFSITADENMTVAKLKEEICAAVEVEIQSQVTEYEISDEEHIAISHAAWARFYSCAVQYHETGLTPMGLVVSGKTGLVVVVKKSSISFVRPVDTLEHLVLHGGDNINGAELFQDTPILCEDALLAQDVVSLMKAIALVGEQIPPELVEEFSQSLYRLNSPDQVAKKIITEVLTDSDGQDFSSLSFSQQLGSRLQQIGDVTKALEVLLYCLELDRGIVSHSEFDPTEPFDDEDLRRSLFSSGIGRSVIAESLKQVVYSRFSLTRNLIALQLIMLECGFADESPTANSAEIIHSTFLPRSVVMAHCYFVLSWITETSSTAPPPDSLEQGLRQMAVLKISGKTSGAQLAAEIARNYPRPLTLSELFLIGPGSKARLLLTSDTDHGTSWHTVLMPLVNICAQLLWPRCAVPSFQEFLLSACQHMQIQEYVRLLSTWCDWNCHSRQFLLGSALLNMGEPEKACDWMVQAAGGIGVDGFLTNHLFNAEESLENSTSDRLTVMYFLKVMNLFEQFGYYDHVIELAKAAIAIGDEDDPDKTTLCYSIFSYHLRLGHYDKAYDAMVSNPDQSRRKDSLRQFVVTLFERKQLKRLASYPYIDMFEDLELIIESRARSVDLSVNNYYDFLYSFHVSKENYRKAAHVMYECAMRLGTETHSLNGLKQQMKCYLACLNALRLVNPDYAWIVKPVLKVMDTASNKLPAGVSPKHSYDGEVLPSSTAIRSRMEVLEAKDIEKEFQLVSARLRLANLKRKKDQSSSAISGPGLSANDALALLVSSNLYMEAVKIARPYKLDCRPIVEGLTSRCVYLSKAKPSDQDSAWDWLAENNFSCNNASTSVEASWNLLKELVDNLEEERQTSIRKAVAIRLLSLGAALPAWLVTSYKKSNAAELLHIYLSHGYLLLASLLTTEYIEAALGNGKEYFGLENALHATSSPMWLPFNLFDQLLLELKEHADDPVYKKHYMNVNATIDRYLNTVKSVSEDMITVRRIS